MRKYGASIAKLVLAFLSCAPLPAAWPVVVPFHATQTYSIHDDSDTPLAARLKTPGGVAVYKIECHNGSYEDMSFINFSGDFQCALYSIEDGRRTSWNLLASNDVAEKRSDFLNRGRMTANQVWGECASIPEYGRLRHFRLRGMQITFEFKDLQWAPAADPKQPRLTGFTFVLHVIPDANATSATADKTSLPWPGGPCQ